MPRRTKIGTITADVTNIEGFFKLDDDVMARLDPLEKADILKDIAHAAENAYNEAVIEFNEYLAELNAAARRKLAKSGKQHETPYVH